MRWGLVALIRKDPSKETRMDNFRPTTLLNTKVKILAKVLTRKLVRVADGPIREVQTCTTPSRSNQDILLTRYIIERFERKPRTSGAFVHFDQT